MDSSPIFIYSLSKDVTTQKIKGKTVSEVIKNTSIFLENCTTENIKNPSGITLESYSPYTDLEDPKIAEAIKSDLTSLFGEGETTPSAYNYPSGEPSHNTRTTWEVENTNLQAAINYIANGRPWPKYTFGPVELIIYYSFLLVDPATKVILPNQADASSIMIWIANISVCSPTLFFPFESKEPFFEYLNKIEPFVPFELRHRYLRSVRPNKNKTGYVYKKLD